ncbi:MAG: metal ABC transporter ATP-binding protein [Acidimicrobiia bacterium]
MNSQGAALSTSALTVVYPNGITALEDVSFSVEPGEMVAVVGPNGAGKSSLFKAIAGLVPHRGSVELGGRSCHHHRDHADAAYIPQRQDLDLDFPITVEQLAMSGRRAFVGFGRRPNRIQRDAVRAALATVELGDARARPLSTLSGGQAQRALLARAIAQEPRLLLLDEALSGVDAPRTEAMFDLFDRLAATGTALLVSTHDLHLARRRFHRCLAVNRTLIADGDPSEVLDATGIVATFGAAAS